MFQPEPERTNLWIPPGTLCAIFYILSVDCLLKGEWLCRLYLSGHKSRPNISSNQYYQRCLSAIDQLLTEVPVL